MYFKKSGYTLFVILTGLFFLFYIAGRADKMSMTHDESSTTNVVDGSYTDIMFAPSMFGTANNHILNSLLLKKMVQMFGWHEWSIRLPNVIFFLVYFFACVFFMNKLSPDKWIRLSGIFFFLAPHFVLDYFSLARGYGIAVAFEMMSLYFLVQYFTTRRTKFIAYSFLFAALAVYANFTWLNILLAQWVILNLVLIIEKKGKSIGSLIGQLIRTNLAPFLITLLLAVLIYKPIEYLSNNNEFKWGSETWAASFQSFVSSLHYTHSYFILHYNDRIFLLKAFLILLPAGSCFMLFQRIFRNKWKQVDAFPYYSLLVSCLLLITLVISTVLQRHLLNTFYIDGRKSLLYVPVLLVLFSSVVTWICQYRQSTGKTIWFLAYTTAMMHFVSIFNFYSCLEWWYDASSKMAYQYIVNDNHPQPKTTAVNWLFSQSMGFYNQRMFGHAIPVLQKTSELKSFDEVNYVYVLGDEIRSVPPQFKPVKRYLWDRFLLRRDSIAYQSDVFAYILQQKINKPNLTFSNEEWMQKADSALLQQRKELNWSYLLYSE